MKWLDISGLFQRPRERGQSRSQLLPWIPFLCPALLGVYIIMGGEGLQHTHSYAHSSSVVPKGLKLKVQ